MEPRDLQQVTVLEELEDGYWYCFTKKPGWRHAYKHTNEFRLVRACERCGHIHSRGRWLWSKHLPGHLHGKWLCPSCNAVFRSIIAKLDRNEELRTMVRELKRRKPRGERQTP